MSTKAAGASVRGSCSQVVSDSFAVPGWIVQQNAWVDDPDSSDNAAYNYPLLLRIYGQLNPEALHSSFDGLLQRHATLRSIFELRGAALTQIVLGEQACPFREIDLTRLDGAEREAAARSVVEAEAEAPFRLAEEIPFRVVLLRLESELHDLLIVTHHLVYDDWSNGILIRELSALYQAFAANQPSPLSDLPVQYSDFVRWSARKMTGHELAANTVFWESQLGDGATFHHLPADITRGAAIPPANGPHLLNCDTRRTVEPSHRATQHDLKRGSREKIILSERLARRLAYWTREQRSSIFMTLLAGFQYLLHHYSHDEDIAVGTCVANRPQMQLEGLIGRFGNHLIIRTSMAGNPSFVQVLQRVREASLTAYGYQEMPFADVLRTARPGVDLRCDSVVQAMFVFQNAPKGAWQIPGLDIRWMPVKRASTRYDLTMWLREAQGIEVTLEYNAELFRASTIQSVLNDYRATLEHVAALPAQAADRPLPNASRGTVRLSAGNAAS
ncbi:MAG TPA: condensation domain-containing protein [Candidatus Acidoferrum sp.]|nr:condensation domain-containing protein [Candidatus Acidoferrum sp.]